MTKSPVLLSKDDYKKWMLSTRLTSYYKPERAPDSSEYPCIIIADTYWDHHYGRDYFDQEVVELKDFSGVPLFVVDEGPLDDKSPSRIIGIYTNKEDGEREAEYRDDYYSMNYQYQEFKLNELK